MVTSKKTTRRRPSLQSIYIHHILWGILCLGLFTILLGAWFYTQKLSSTNRSLEQKISLLNAPPPTCSARDTWPSETTKTFETLTDDGTRNYSVHLPANFDETRYYPLIVHFPGKSATADGGEKQAGLNVLPAVIVYPHPTIGKDRYTSWQGAPYSSGVNDVSFTEAILDKVQSQLCIDRDRVYATGLSNGGGMVSLLSCTLSDRFAAFGIVAGAMYYPSGACKPPRPTPLMTIHGDNDPNVPYAGSATRKLPDISKWSAERANDNGCKSNPVVRYQDAVTIVTTWQNCTNSATIENVKLRGGGHLWMPEATQTLWNFLSQHSL